MNDAPFPDMDNPSTCICLKKAREQTCVLRRCVQWLWSTWIGGSSTPHSSLPEARVCEQNPQETVEEVERSAYPCKACQAWGVTCDRQQPRCSHCLDQQILCFYVAPPRKVTKSKPKRRLQERNIPA
ncbi:hypothetical protein BDV59DRAFT_59002 [Aspergillus ambiguus]|uniref:uncharacterized protein n=1 Tax=Aspergillus ambiguus TaxID=176160 RepID=UPI003CCD2067